MTHSSYKSLLVSFAIAMLGAGCAIAPEGEGETTQTNSTDLEVDHVAVTPDRAESNATTNVAVPSQQQITIHPTTLHVLAGPKPNPWDDNGNSGTGGTGTGTGTGSNSK